MVHHQLLHLKALSDPATEDVMLGKLSGTEAAVAGSHSEFTDLETRLKTAMQAQDLTEVADLKLSPSNGQRSR